MSENALFDHKLVTFHPFGLPRENRLRCLGVAVGEGGDAASIRLLSNTQPADRQPWLMVPARPSPAIRFSPGDSTLVYYVTYQHYGGGSRLSAAYGYSLGVDADRAAVWPGDFWRTAPWRLHRSGTGKDDEGATRGWRLESMLQKKDTKTSGPFLRWRGGSDDERVDVGALDAKIDSHWEIRSWPSGDRILWQV